MAIRFLDIAARRAQLAAVLGGVSAVLSGTHTPPPGRTGILGPQLSGIAANFQGLFTTAPNRTGQLVSTLGGISSAVAGTFAGQQGDPVWLGSLIVFNTLQVGVAFSLDLNTEATDPSHLPITYTLAAALPAGLAQSGALGNIISGIPTVAVVNFQIDVWADNGQGVIVPSWNTAGPVL